MGILKNLFVWIVYRLVVTLLAAIAGWFVVSIVIVLGSVASGSIATAGSTSYAMENGLMFSYVMGVYVLAAWGFVLFPLTLPFPRSSAFWKPAVLPLVGMIVGPTVMGLALLYGWFFPATDTQSDGSIVGFALIALYGIACFCIPAAMVGAATGCVLAWINQRVSFKTTSTFP